MSSDVAAGASPNDARVVVTGGAGFLGALLARRLLDARSIEISGELRTIGELVLLDLVEPPEDLLGHPTVRSRVGALADTVGGLEDADVVFHLAAVVSGQAEADLDAGLVTNLGGTRALLDRCRGFAAPPLVVFASSIAVFGHDPAGAPLQAVLDDTLPRPQTSYGVQKFIGEQLVADYGRRGLIDGRSVRIVTVSVRPGRPNAAASGFLSGILREPIAGQPSECPVAPDAPVAISSPRRTVDGLLRAAAVPPGVWGSRTAMTLPALATTPGEMVAALERVAGPGVAALVRWGHDPSIAAMVAGWPGRFVTDRASALGLDADPDVDSIIRDYIADHPEAVARASSW